MYKNKEKKDISLFICIRVAGLRSLSKVLLFLIQSQSMGDTRGKTAAGERTAK
jgi:hypothetical protein